MTARKDWKKRKGAARVSASPEMKNSAAAQHRDAAPGAVLVRRPTVCAVRAVLRVHGNGILVVWTVATRVRVGRRAVGSPTVTVWVYPPGKGGI